MKNDFLVLLILLNIFCLLPGCTLHFKGTDLEFDTKAPEARIGTALNTEGDFYLAGIDVFGKPIIK